MTDQTVNTLAKTVGVPVERLLNQMEEAGLTRRAATDAVSDEERKSLLSHLQKSHGGEGDNPDGPKKITLQRKRVLEPLWKEGLNKARFPSGEFRL
jgi:translation initiation factor IF-2